MYKLWDCECSECNVRDEYLLNGNETQTPCRHCTGTAYKKWTPATGRALYFEEGRTRTITNLESLGPGNISTGPARVSSKRQHERLMKEQDVRLATAADHERFTNRRKERTDKGPGRWV